MKNKIIKIGFLAVLFVVLFGVIGPVQAQLGSNPDGPYIGLEYGQYTGLGEQDVRFTIAMVIRIALGLLGTVALVLILYAGFKWMTAGGNEEDVTSAKKILIAAVIGLAIILGAYSITRFVTTQLFKATTGYDYDIIINDT